MKTFLHVCVAGLLLCAATLVSAQTAPLRVGASQFLSAPVLPGRSHSATRAPSRVSRSAQAWPMP